MILYHSFFLKSRVYILNTCTAQTQKRLVINIPLSSLKPNDLDETRLQIVYTMRTSFLSQSSQKYKKRKEKRQTSLYRKNNNPASLNKNYTCHHICIYYHHIYVSEFIEYIECMQLELLPFSCCSSTSMPHRCPCILGSQVWPKRNLNSPLMHSPITINNNLERAEMREKAQTFGILVDPNENSLMINGLIVLLHE
jgi:hypothetical protein